MKLPPNVVRSPLASKLLAAMSLAAMSTACLTPLHAVDFYWGSDTTGDETAAATSWQDTTHWFSDAAGTIASDAIPGASDTAIFSINSLNNTALIPRIWADTTIGTINFKNTASFSLTGGGANRLLHIGSGGINVDPGAAAITLGTSTANRNILVRILADQTWTNNSSTTLNIRNSAAASNLAAGNVVLTLNAAGSGTITNSGAFSDGTAGSLGLVINSTGTGIVSTQSGTYSGGTTIKRGILQTNGATIGTANVLLGDTTGAFNATLRVNTTAAITSNLVVQSGNTGTNALEFISTSAGNYSGDITLNNNLVIGARSSTSGTTLSGAISGSGDLIKGQYQGSSTTGLLTLGGANTHSGNTTINYGAFTLAETGSLTFYVGANGVTNQVNGSSTGAVTFNGTFNFDLSGADLTDGNSWLIVDVDTLTESFSSTFAVAGFSDDDADNIWIKDGWSFSEASGVLAYTAIPEPSTYALMMGAGLLGYAGIRRKGRHVKG